MWKCKEPRIPKELLKKKMVGGVALPDIKTYKAVIIKAICYWCRIKQTDQLNRITSLNQIQIYVDP